MVEWFDSLDPLVAVFVVVMIGLVSGLILGGLASLFGRAVDSFRSWRHKKAVMKRWDEAQVGKDPDHAQEVSHTYMQEQIAKWTGYENIVHAWRNAAAAVPLEWVKFGAKRSNRNHWESRGSSRGGPWLAWYHPEDGWIRCGLRNLPHITEAALAYTNA